MVCWVHVRFFGWTYTDFVEILLQHEKSFNPELMPIWGYDVA
jgi:hypothetical protein